MSERGERGDNSHSDGAFIFSRDLHDRMSETADSTPTESDESTAIAEPGPVRKTIRTVTPSYGGRPDAEMDSIGWMLFLGLVILFLPLLPILVVGWLVVKTIEFVAQQTR